MFRPRTDTVFSGSVATIYEKHLVPLIFEPYAQDIAQRVASRSVTRVLEIAAGTGVVTRILSSTLPGHVSIVATDLNPPMLDEAAARGTRRPVVWRQADAMQLPFTDASFDAVVCQFGVMFFPDKAGAFAEAHRVLQPSGALLFNTWDRLEDNEFADAVHASLESLFPGDPPRFLARTPHGYFDRAAIEQDLSGGGFTERIEFHTLTARSRAESAHVPSLGYCLGTPLRNEIVARDASMLGRAVEVATQSIARRFGDGAVDGKIQAHVIVAEKR